MCQKSHPANTAKAMDNLSFGLPIADEPLEPDIADDDFNPPLSQGANEKNPAHWVD